MFGEIKLNAVPTKIITFAVIFIILAFAVTLSANETETDYTIHKIQKGESLWHLSLSNYGTSRYAYLLAEYNNIKNVQRIQIDQEIKIPKAFSYKIKVGDTLFKISRRLLGDSRKYKDLAEYNDISNPNIILKGSKLEIPLKPNIDVALAEKRGKAKPIAEEKPTPEKVEKPIIPEEKPKEELPKPIEEKLPVVEEKVPEKEVPPPVEEKVVQPEPEPVKPTVQEEPKVTPEEEKPITEEPEKPEVVTPEEEKPVAEET